MRQRLQGAGETARLSAAPTDVPSTDWGRCAIARFGDLPDSAEVHVIDRPGMPVLGTGEAAQGPRAAAIANAPADATDVRLRELPLDGERVKASLGA